MQDQHLSLQKRDFEILRGLFVSRVMTATHIGTLYFGGKSEAAKKRLQKIKARGFIGEQTPCERKIGSLFNPAGPRPS